MFCFVGAALPWLGCGMEGDASTGSRLGSESTDGGVPFGTGSPGAPIPNFPAPEPIRPTPPPDARAADRPNPNPRPEPGRPSLVCDPNDQRYCLVAQPEEGVACADRWEDVGERLTCADGPRDNLGLPPRNAVWEVRQGPTCLMATWRWREHEETCFYDARTGWLTASTGYDACGIYCGGVKRVTWNEVSWEDCGNTMLVASAMCREDGIAVPVPVNPTPGVDAGVRRRDGGVPALDAGRPDHVAPPPPPIFDGGTLH